MDTVICKHNHDEFLTGTVCLKCEDEALQADKERRNAEWREKARIENEKRQARNLAYYQRIATAVRAQGGKANIQGKVYNDSSALFVEGVDVSFFVEFRETYTHRGRFGHGPTGKLAITVGDYGSRKSYPQRKDGTHKYEAIAADLIYLAKGRKVMAKMDTARSLNRSVVDRFKRQTGVADYGAFQVSPSTSEDKPIAVNFKINNNMTVEQASHLYKTLRDLGVTN